MINWVAYPDRPWEFRPKFNSNPACHGMSRVISRRTCHWEAPREVPQHPLGHLPRPRAASHATAHGIIYIPWLVRSIKPPTENSIGPVTCHGKITRDPTECTVERSDFPLTWCWNPRNFPPALSCEVTRSMGRPMGKVHPSGSTMHLMGNPM